MLQKNYLQLFYPGNEEKTYQLTYCHIKSQTQPPKPPAQINTIEQEGIILLLSWRQFQILCNLEDQEFNRSEPFIWPPKQIYDFIVLWADLIYFTAMLGTMHAT